MMDNETAIHKYFFIVFLHKGLTMWKLGSISTNVG